MNHSIRVKMFLVAIRSEFVRSIYLEEIGDTIPESSKFKKCSVVVGAAGGETGEDVIQKIALEYNLPEESLIAYELAY